MKFWLRRSCPSKQSVDIIHKGVAEHIALGQWEAAHQKLKPLLENDLGDNSTTLLHAKIMRGMRQFECALSLINQGLDKAPNNLSLLQERGKTLLEQGNPHKALEDLTSCEAILRTEEDILDLATAYFQTGNIKEAWLYLADYLYQSKNGRLLSLAGDCHFYWQNWEQAITIYYKAQKCGWNNSRILNRIGYGLFSLGHVKEASRYFQQILREDSSNILATLGFGSSQEVQGDYEKALLTYQSGKAWDEGNPHVLQRAGICAARLQLHRFAEIYLKESLNSGFHSPETFTFLAYSLEKQYRFEEAEEIYLKLISEFPDHVAGYRGISWLFGVGLTTKIDDETGLYMAEQSLEKQADEGSWEIMSACEARVGNYEKAHVIQEQLASKDLDKMTRQRRQRAMRTLRRRMPLNESMVSPVLVA